MVKRLISIDTAQSAGSQFPTAVRSEIAVLSPPPITTVPTVLTASTAPTAGQWNVYDATGGALTPPLPALSGLSVGAAYPVQRSVLDISSNAITFTPNGSDTFDSGSTAFSLPLKGEIRILQVVTVSGAKKWKIVGGNTPLSSLDRRYGAQNRGSVGVWFGDSIGTAGDQIVGSANLVDHTVRSESTFNYASILLGQRLRYFYNASKGGDSVTGSVPTNVPCMQRWTTDVDPLTFSFLVWAIGTNDSFLQTSLANYAAAVKDAHARTMAHGAEFIIATIPPNNNVSGTPSNRKVLINQYNHFLRDYAAKHGLLVIDFHALLVDPTNGSYLGSLTLDDGTVLSPITTDGTHPVGHGYYAMGKLVADTLALYLPPYDPPLPLSLNDGNLVAEPFFLGGLNGSFVPTGWSMPSGVLRTGVTASLVSGDADIKGNWFKMAFDNTFSGPQTLFQTISSGITPGRTYRLLGRVKQIAPVTISITGRIAFDANFDYTGTGVQTHEFRPMHGLAHAIPSGVFWIDCVAPSGASTAQLNFQVVGNGGTGEVHLAQIGLYDITDIEAAL